MTHAGVFLAWSVVHLRGGGGGGGGGGKHKHPAGAGVGGGLVAKQTSTSTDLVGRRHRARTQSRARDVPRSLCIVCYIYICALRHSSHCVIRRPAQPPQQCDVRISGISSETLACACVFVYLLRGSARGRGVYTVYIVPKAAVI